MSSVDSSCLEEIEKTVHLPLPLSYSNNVISGVSDILESWKSKYSSVLNGIVVGFRDVSFVNPRGRLLGDQCWVHYDIKAIFSVFKPEAGKLLKGTVNRISKQHIGCLVHGGINVSIFLPSEITNNVAKFVDIGKDVIFKVTHVDTRRRVIQVKGVITAECVLVMEKEMPKLNTHIRFSECDTVSETQDCIANSESAKGKKRKRNSLSTNDNSSDNIFDVLTQSSSSTSNEHIVKRVKKAKRVTSETDEPFLSEANNTINLKESDIKAEEEECTESINSQKIISSDSSNSSEVAVVVSNLNPSHREGSSKTTKKSDKSKKIKLKVGRSKKKDKSKKLKDKLKKKKDKSKSKKAKKKKKEK